MVGFCVIVGCLRWNAAAVLAPRDQNLAPIRYSANANRSTARHLLAIVSDPQLPLSPSAALIQTLCQDIDRLLATSVAPWRYPAQLQAQRQLLQRLRDVLVLWPGTASTEPVTAAAQATHVLVVEALQTDIQQLLQTRQALQQEVAQLSAQRAQQQAQMLLPLIEQVEQLERFQTRTNNMLQDVDRSLQLTLRTADSDIAAYEQSLAQRLTKLDDLSQQSETIVATLFQQLLQEIQQLRSSPSSISAVDAGGTPALPAPLDVVAIGAASTIAASTVSASTVSASAVNALAPAMPIAQLSEILPRLGITAASTGWVAAFGKPDSAKDTPPATALPDSPDADDYLLEIDDL